MSHIYPENQIYGIINTSDLASVDFTQVMPNQSDEVRYSLDGLMFVVKWEEDHDTYIHNGWDNCPGVYTITRTLS